MRGGRGACVDASPDDAEFSPPPTPPPPSLRIGPPPPLPRGRMKQAISFSRCDPHPSHRHATRISSLSAPIFAREHRRWSPVSSRSVLRATNVRTEKSKEAERRQTRIQPPHLSGAARAERCALASRRPTTALCQWDYSSQGSTWARLRDTPAHGRVPRQPVWHFQRCTSRAGHSAGRLMPRPPGSGSDEPPRAGTASRSVLRGHRTTSLYASEIDGHFSKLKRDVKAFLFVQINPDVAQGGFLLTRPQTRFTPTKIRRQRNCAH